jgi:transposase
VVPYSTVVGRGELTDKGWAVIEPLLPKVSTRNGRWHDRLQVIRGSCGSYGLGRRGGTCPNGTGRGRLVMNVYDGGRLLARGTGSSTAAQVRDDGELVQWTIGVDSSIMRAHQPAAGVGRKGIWRRGGDGWCAVVAFRPRP